MIVSITTTLTVSQDIRTLTWPLCWWLVELDVVGKLEMKLGASEEPKCMCAPGPPPRFFRRVGAADPTNPGPPLPELLSFSCASSFATESIAPTNLT